MSEPTDRQPSAELSDLLRALSSAPKEHEVVGEAEAVASMQSAIASAGATEGATMYRYKQRTRIAVLAAAGVLTVGGAAAAGFDPTDRPPVFDAPPTDRPPVELPENARGDDNAGGPDAEATTTTTTTDTSTTTTTVADSTTTTTTAADTTTTTTDESTTTTAGESTTTTAAPGGVECAEGNHGETVSSIARAVPPGPDHGPAVAAAAQSDCGKTGDDGETTETTATETTATETTVTKTTVTETTNAPGRSGEAGSQRPENPGPPEHAGRPENPGRSGDSPGHGNSGD